MASIFALAQYLIKEYFVYIMALYTLIFILAATLFVKYRTNRRLVANRQAAPTQTRGARRPVVSISGNKLVFADPKTLHPNAKELLKKCGETSEIYIVTQVGSDEEEKQVRATLNSEPELKQNIKEHRVMFCSTENGVRSIVRQLNPDIHYEWNASSVKDMVQYLRKVVYIGEENLNNVLAGVQVKAVIRQFRGLDGLLQQLGK